MSQQSPIIEIDSNFWKQAHTYYREFGGKEQREEPRVREFREFGTARLQGITVFLDNHALLLWNTKS